MTMLRDCLTLITVAFGLGFQGASAQRQHLLFEDDSETGRLATGWSEEKCCPHSIRVVADPVRPGNRVVQFELRKEDGLVATSKRTELVLPREAQLKVERWYGFRVFLPDDYLTDPAQEIIAQWHESPDFHLGETWRSPPISFSTNNGEWRMNLRWDADKVNDNRADGTESLNFGPYEKGVWVDWVFHLKFSWEADGLLEVWKNGKLLTSRKGPNAYNDERGVYFKQGFYKWLWKPNNDKGNSTTTRRVRYTDEFRIGDEQATYQDVAPGGSSPTAQLSTRDQTVSANNLPTRSPEGNLKISHLLYGDTFNGTLSNWVFEAEKPATSKAVIGAETLMLKSDGGATLWFKYNLSGNLLIEYDLTALPLENTGPTAARSPVSNLNQFWMATDPANPKLFTRHGKFAEYDSLKLYYVGMGGWDNTTTRFRRYDGTGAKPILKEYTDKAHLVEANQRYSVKIVVNNGQTQFFVNGMQFFDLTDANPLREGHFGFRLFNNRVRVSHFNVYQLE